MHEQNSKSLKVETYGNSSSHSRLLPLLFMIIFLVASLGSPLLVHAKAPSKSTIGGEVEKSTPQAAGAGRSDENNNNTSGQLGNQGNDRSVGNAGGNNGTQGIQSNPFTRPTYAKDEEIEEDEQQEDNQRDHSEKDISDQDRKHNRNEDDFSNNREDPADADQYEWQTDNQKEASDYETPKPEVDLPEKAEQQARENTAHLARENAEKPAREAAKQLAHQKAVRLAFERAKRLARIEAELLETERLARIEDEQLARIEAERLEAKRLARIEAKRLEAEQLARIEAERLETERLARIEAERLEAEQLARIEVERLEAERLARIEAEELVREAAAAPVDFGDYPIGYIWKRVREYTPGTTKNSIFGNPDDDLNGNPVWQMEWINATTLGVNDPWYLQPTQKMLWESVSWLPNRWTNEAGGNISKWDLNTGAGGDGFGYLPLVRWINPTGSQILVNVGGYLRLHWYGLDKNPAYPGDPNYWDDYLVGSPVDVDAVIGVKRKDGTIEVLYKQRFSKPHDGETTCLTGHYLDCDYTDLPMDLNVALEDGDSIFWSHRALNNYPGQNRWITMNDNSLTIRRPGFDFEMNKFYAIESGINKKQLISIDPDTGQSKVELLLHGLDDFRSFSLAFSPDGKLFGWDNARTQLYQIDPMSGKIIHIGNPTYVQKINGLAFDKDGKLYGLNSNTDELVSIDPLTSIVTVIGNAGFDIRSTGLAINFKTNELYAVSGNSTDSVFKLDKLTGAAEIIGSMGITYHGVGVEFSPVTGELFAIRRSNILMRIDTATGIGTEVAVIDGINTVSMAAPWPVKIEADKFYAMEPSGSAQRLVSIDPETLKVNTLFGLTGKKGFSTPSLAFSPDGKLYGWSSRDRQLYNVDLQTGKVALIGERAIWGAVNSLAFDADGNLYGLHGPSNQLLSIDINTSAITIIGHLGLDIKNNGLAIDFKANELYAVSGNDTDNLLSINKQTGLAQAIGSLGIQTGGVAAEFNAATGKLYSIRATNLLVEVDIYTGIATEIGTLEGMHSVNMAAPWPEKFDLNLLYSVEPTWAIERLVSINPETLEVATALELTGETGFSSTATAFSPNGELYGWDTAVGQLYRIDLYTGEVSHIGEPTGLRWVNGLTFNKGGKLYGLHGGTDTLLSIDLETSNTSVAGHFGMNIKNTGMAARFSTNELYAVTGAIDNMPDYLLKINTDLSPVLEDDNYSNNTSSYNWTYRGNGVSYTWSPSGHIHLDGIQSAWQPAYVQAEKSMDIPARGYAKLDFDITQRGVGQSRIIFKLQEDVDSLYKFVMTDSTYGSSGHTQGIAKILDGAMVDGNTAFPGSLNDIGSYSMEMWWSPIHMRVRLINTDTNAVIFNKRFHTTDTTSITPTSFSFKAYRFAVNWKSIKIHPGVEEIIGELGVDYGGVGVEFNAATGKLYSVRNGNLLMELDAESGVANEVGLIEGVSTVNMSAPWPM